MDFIFFIIIITRIFPPIGFLLNFLAIWLILTKTPNEMAIHSRILLQTCIFDIIYLLLQIFGMPILARQDEIIIGTFYGYFAAELQRFFGPIGLMVNEVLNGSLIISNFLLILFQFTYKYFLFNRNTQISFSRYLQLLLLPIFLYIIAMSIIIYKFHDNILECRAEDIIYLVGMNMLGESCFLLTDGMSILAFQFVWAFDVIGMTILFTIIIFLRWRTIRFVNAQTGLSEYSKMLIKQLTRTLTLLAALPFMSISYMILMSIFLFLFGIGVNSTWQMRHLQFGSLIIFSTPMLNPLITIFTNTPYRRAIARILNFWDKSHQQIVPIGNNTTQ